MAYKGSFNRTILLSFFVLAIVTVIHGRPAGSSEATEGTVKIIHGMAPVIPEEMLQHDVVKEGDGGCKKCQSTQVADFEVGQLGDNVEHLHQLRCNKCDDCCSNATCAFCRDVMCNPQFYNVILCCCY